MAELDGAGNVVARFVYGTKSNVPDYVVKGRQTYRIFTDHLGSVRLVVNAATGEVAQRLEYDAFGVVLEDTAPGFQPFGFAGGLYEAATGLVRFGARDYDAEVGRWTSKDPILFRGGGTNLLSYASNEPVNTVDRNGKQVSDLILCVAAGGLPPPNKCKLLDWDLGPYRRPQSSVCRYICNDGGYPVERETELPKDGQCKPEVNILDTKDPWGIFNKLMRLIPLLLAPSGAFGTLVGLGF